MSLQAIFFYIVFYGSALFKVWYATVPLLIGFFFGSRYLLQSYLKPRHISSNLIALIFTIFFAVGLSILSVVVFFHRGKIDFP